MSGSCPGPERTEPHKLFVSLGFLLPELYDRHTDRWLGRLLLKKVLLQRQRETTLTRASQRDVSRDVAPLAPWMPSFVLGGAVFQSLSALRPVAGCRIRMPMADMGEAPSDALRQGAFSPRPGASRHLAALSNASA